MAYPGIDIATLISYLCSGGITFLTVYVITAVYGAARRKEAALSDERAKSKDGKRSVFVVSPTRAIFGTGVFCMIVFGFFIGLCIYAVVGQGTLTGNLGIGVFVVFGFFFAMSACLALQGARWSLVVSDYIIYTPTIGRTQIIQFEDIYYATLSMNYLRVYDHYHRRIFTLQATCVGGATFIRLLQIKGIPLNRPCSYGTAFAYGLQHRGEHRVKTYAQKPSIKRLSPGNGGE